ncbi:MAG: symmetrical bis(5'-nucleosyl)-tetraphosphatase [Hahellaceae bacterium]|nr:symmetrical bis(5'-nucleosyl)-tetraphosphatase [Hahellaceae bacterium]MCP5170439.1 symmetrical bis(5'-nucleosyl)-tetraphosphatase [Hahellaceae bacterium]
MTRYAVGDIQGCYDELQQLLAQVSFDPSVDQLWVVGDLVNRGPKSLETLRLIRSLGTAARVVLGNHDLHLLAVACGAQKHKRKDSFDDVLNAPDASELLAWLQACPLMLCDEAHQLIMTHAGLPHIWSVSNALQYAGEVAKVLQGPNAKEFFHAMYGNEPATWDESLTGMTRLRVITNYFTRMRFVAADGGLDFGNKFEPESAPPGFAPWFDYPRQDKVRIVFGHWAALMGKLDHEHFIGLDTGCVWGNDLTMLNLDSLGVMPRQIYCAPCRGTGLTDD